MRIRFSLVHAGKVVDHQDHEVKSEEDLPHAAAAAFAHFKANHPSTTVLQAGVQIIIARE